MKKSTAILLICLFLLSLCACGLEQADRPFDTLEAPDVMGVFFTLEGSGPQVTRQQYSINAFIDMLNACEFESVPLEEAESFVSEARAVTYHFQVGNKRFEIDSKGQYFVLCEDHTGDKIFSPLFSSPVAAYKITKGYDLEIFQNLLKGREWAW